MSFFVLFRNDHQRCALGNFFAAASTRPRRIDLGNASIFLFGNQSGSESPYFETENGDFIAVLGSLLFAGEATPICLPALLGSFDPDTFSWDGLLGTHVILIHKAGTLHVVADGLGASRIYTNENSSVWSNSFLAMLEVAGPKAFDRQACYEYVISGSVFGRRTLVEGISSLPANAILSVTSDETRVHQRPSPIANEPLDGPITLDRVADYHCTRLSDVFAPIANNYGDRIRLSFSGGFDSRLMLAMLMKHGARPMLFVYGDDNDEDVRIARTICKAEGLTLECINKSTVPAPDPDAFVGETEKNLFAFDGWKVETPLFDFGEDRQDRLKRHVDGQVPLNGSLGEIYRNFFYMPDRPSSTGAVISTFYSRYDPRAFTDRFDEKDYRSAMAASMREAIGAESDELTRSQVEEVYPKFRGRFWTGRDAQINQRFGPMFFPFLEHAAISNTAKIPIGLKDLGYLQGRMIGRVNSRLADYPSDYGFALNGPRPLKYRVKTFLGTQRPPVLRKLSFRMTHRAQEARTGALSPAYLSKVIDLEIPIMRSLFNLDAVNSATQYGLIATLEYLGQRYNLQIADD
jgi:asparagine synthase (glutamine-hydrolysing)